MPLALQKAGSGLLVLLFVIATGWQHDSLVMLGCPDSVSKLVCKCCDYDPAKCATPACCNRRGDTNRAPVAPAPRPASGSELLAIASAPFTHATLPRFTLPDLASIPARIQAEAVPIFQRDCSRLI